MRTKKVKEEEVKMSKEAFVPSEWMQTVMGASELPQEGSALGPFPHPLPQVKFNQNRKRALISEDAENEKYFLKGVSFSRDLVRMIPLLVQPRYELWTDNKPVYVDPTKFGPDPDAPEGGSNVLRLVYMDADTHDVYAVDLKNETSKREGKKLQAQMAQDLRDAVENGGMPHYGYVYNLFCYQGTPNQFGGNPFYPRIQRSNEGDPMKKGFKTERDDNETGPSYEREEVEQEVYDRLNKELNTDSTLAVAVKLNMLASKHAADVIRKVQSGQMTNAQALKEVPKVEK